MEHYYRQITGWLTFPQFYSDMVRRFPDGSKFAEVGTYSGQSFAYLLVEIENQGKKIDCTAIDSYTFTDEKTGENILTALRRNLKVFEGKYKVIKDISWEAADCFDDGSLDFVFLDADHVEESVRKDITAWLPKVKSGGIIAGHDFCDPRWWENDHPGVEKVVREFWGDDSGKEYLEEKVWYKQL